MPTLRGSALEEPTGPFIPPPAHIKQKEVDSDEDMDNIYVHIPDELIPSKQGIVMQPPPVKVEEPKQKWFKKMIPK